MSTAIQRPLPPAMDDPIAFAQDLQHDFTDLATFIQHAKFAIPSAATNEAVTKVFALMKTTLFRIGTENKTVYDLFTRHMDYFKFASCTPPTTAQENPIERREELRVLRRALMHCWVRAAVLLVPRFSRAAQITIADLEQCSNAVGQAVLHILAISKGSPEQAVESACRKLKQHRQPEAQHNISEVCRNLVDAVHGNGTSWIVRANIQEIEKAEGMFVVQVEVQQAARKLEIGVEYVKILGQWRDAEIRESRFNASAVRTGTAIGPPPLAHSFVPRGRARATQQLRRVNNSLTPSAVQRPNPSSLIHPATRGSPAHVRATGAARRRRELPTQMASYPSINELLSQPLNNRLPAIRAPERHEELTPRIHERPQHFGDEFGSSGGAESSSGPGNLSQQAPAPLKSTEQRLPGVEAVESGTYHRGNNFLALGPRLNP